MLEIPETRTISSQADSMLSGKRISKVYQATSHHRFIWYNGNPQLYQDILVGRQIELAKGHGAFVDLVCEDDTIISISDGTNIKYYPPIEKHSAKHQLLIQFDGGSFITFTVCMYGAIYAYHGILDNLYHHTQH